MSVPRTSSSNRPLATARASPQHTQHTHTHCYEQRLPREHPAGGWAHAGFGWATQPTGKVSKRGCCFSRLRAHSGEDQVKPSMKQPLAAFSTTHQRYSSCRSALPPSRDRGACTSHSSHAQNGTRGLLSSASIPLSTSPLLLPCCQVLQHTPLLTGMGVSGDPGDTPQPLTPPSHTTVMRGRKGCWGSSTACHPAAIQHSIHSGYLRHTGHRPGTTAAAAGTHTHHPRVDSNLFFNQPSKQKKKATQQRTFHRTDQPMDTNLPTRVIRLLGQLTPQPPGCAG
jgi:hypothetical protein